MKTYQVSVNGFQSFAEFEAAGPPTYENPSADSRRAGPFLVFRGDSGESVASFEVGFEAGQATSWWERLSSRNTGVSR